MDTRKLFLTEGTAVICDANNIIAKAIHATRNAPRNEARQLAAELVKRWNDHFDLVRHLDCILTQYEDSGKVSFDDMRTARERLTTMGWDEKALGELADYHEQQDSNS